MLHCRDRRAQRGRAVAVGVRLERVAVAYHCASVDNQLARAHFDCRCAFNFTAVDGHLAVLRMIYRRELSADFAAVDCYGSAVTISVALYSSISAF